MEDSKVQEIITQAKKRSLRIVTAESLTCGRIASTLANIAGSSAVINGGFIVYQDKMKTLQLGVPLKILKTFSAVSQPVAEAMAKGALEKTSPEFLGDEASNISIAVTGYAGSTAGLASEDLAGLVYIALGYYSPTTAITTIRVSKYQFSGDRESVRQATTDEALQSVLDLIYTS